MTICYLFPGQGSLEPGMGKGLFEAFPEETALADDILGYSVRRLCEEDPDGNLNRTRYTQPALFTVCALTYMRRLGETGRAPDFVTGHSLGEYAALFAAGAFDFATGLALVQKRGALMAEADGGAMAAVMGMAREPIVERLAAGGFEAVDLANLNAPEQTVISGRREDIDGAAKLLEAAGAWVVPLKVSGAFHSRYMQAARRDFEAFLENFVFSPLQLPVIANVDARPHEQRRIKENLCRQITQPVRWSETIRFLLAQPEPEFEELGPGTVLTGLVRQIRAAAAA